MERIGEPTTEQSIEVAARPEAVWQVVSDVTRTPEWSPVCHRCEWLDGATGPAVGARFRGHNRLNGARWSRVCEVTAAEPGVEFAFSTTFKGRESTRWRYRLEPVGTGTRIHEAYEVVSMPTWVRVMRMVPGAMAKTERDTQRNLETSLARLKAIVEG